MQKGKTSDFTTKIISNHLTNIWKMPIGQCLEMVSLHHASVFFGRASDFARESAMWKLPEERRKWGESKGAGREKRKRRTFFLPSPSPLSSFRPCTYRKGYYFYSPQSSTDIKSKMAATTMPTRTRFHPSKIRLHCRLAPQTKLNSG